MMLLQDRPLQHLVPPELHRVGLAVVASALTARLAGLLGDGALINVSAWGRISLSCLLDRVWEAGLIQVAVATRLNSR